MQVQASVRSDGCILIGNSVTCDGFDPSYVTRIQTNLNRLVDDFSSSLGYQDQIVLSHQSYNLLIKDFPNLKYRNTFKPLPSNGSYYTVGEIKISLLDSGYMLGSVMPLIETIEGTAILYSSDFLLPTYASLPKVDILVLDAKCWNDSFIWGYTKEDSIACFDAAFSHRIQNGPLSVIGNRGSIEIFILSLLNRTNYPIYVSSRIYNILEFVIQDSLLLNKLHLIDISSLRNLIDSNHLFVSFFEPEDRLYRDLFNPSAQILIEDAIKSPSHPTCEYENGLLQICVPNRADFNGIISLVQNISPDFVLTDGSRGGNARRLAEYISYTLGIQASYEINQVGFGWGGTTTNIEEKFISQVNKTEEIKSNTESSVQNPSISAKRLIVIVPAEGQKTESWSSLVNRLRQENEFSETEFLLWDHGYCNFSYKSVFKLSRQLKAKVDERWMYNGPYQEVFFIGHCLGSLLVRQAYLLASGSYQGFDESRWYAYVRRMVLFSPLNQGLDPSRSLSMSVALWLEKYLSIPLRWALPKQDLYRGSSFLTNLTINWIRHFRSAQYPLSIIQVLSSIDSVLTRDDCIDLKQFPGARNIDVSDTTYQNIHRLDISSNPEEKFKLFKEALLGVTQDYLEEVTDNEVEIVIFALHGIRASNGGWVRQVSSTIRQKVPNAEVITSSYDYFTAFNFLLPLLRKRNIEWFQDQYAYYFSRYSDATFHFIGHSNGTYILGETLKRVPGMKFSHVYLAGSVLPKDYPWRDRFENRQLDKLRNDRSSDDWPVGILCSGLRGIGMTDIGTGGFDGFLFGDSRVEEFCYFNGDHGKPLDERNIESIINFILTGYSSIDEELLPENKVRLRFWSRVSPHAAQGFLVLVIYFIYVGVTSSNMVILGAIVILFFIARLILNIL